MEIDAAFFASMLGAESVPKVPQPVPVPEPAAANAPAARATGQTCHARSAGTARAVPAPATPVRKTPVPVFDRADADGDGLILKEESFEEAPDALEPADEDAVTQKREPLAPLARLREHGWSLGALVALLLLARRW